MRFPDRVRSWLVVLVLTMAGAFPAIVSAEPAPQLYFGHSARLTVQIPGDWRVDPTGVFDYVGANGVVRSAPVSGTSLQDACVQTSRSPLFDSTPRITDEARNGDATCRIRGQIAGREVIAQIVPHAFPFTDTYADEHYAYAALIADPAHLDAIAATLSFDPARVTPEAYVRSVLDIVQTRAYWTDAVDWDLTRQQALTAVEGLDAHMAQGAIQGIVQRLHASGDNHSYVIVPGQVTGLTEAQGLGLLVADRHVVLVYPNGPAGEAGVQPGDVIEAVDGTPYTPRTLGPVAPEAVWGHAPTLTIRRQGEAAPITVSMEQRSFDRFLAPLGQRLPDGVGYLQVLSIGGSRAARVRYGTAARQFINDVSQTETCGWVVDLRLNGGGVYGPMVGGLVPILGEGRFLGWRGPEGRQTWVDYRDGRILDDGRDIAAYLADLPAATLPRPGPPVAILTSPLTASSGEATALAFVGRPDTRLFGEPTAGATTGIEGISLFDGTVLGLATVAMTDRTGATHLDGVMPDERIRIDWTTYGTADDPVLSAATAWLREQPACANATPVP